MRKPVKITSDTNQTSMKCLINYLNSAKIPYQLSVSNYTVTVTSKSVKANFSKTTRSKKFFSAFSKIKSDVSRHPNPKVRRSDVKYFEHDFKDNFFAPEIINIDLRNAYATVLFNAGFIGNETYEYLAALPKLERLGAIGMLASKKYVFNYGDKGELINYKKVIGEFESFFYYCAKMTQDLMIDLKRICGKNFLFTWVDSIYFKPDELAEIAIKEYIEQCGFNYSKATLINFDVDINGGKIKLSYEKDGDQTYFFIPPKDNVFSDQLAAFLTGKTIHLENSNFKVTPKIGA